MEEMGGRSWKQTVRAGTTWNSHAAASEQHLEFHIQSSNDFGELVF